MTMRNLTIIATSLAILGTAAIRVHAQTAAAPTPSPITQANSEAPLEITADETLEWHRNEKQFIARGNVKTTQGDVTIIADTQTADYRETESSSFDIYELTADGHVRISSRGNTAEGDLAVYEVDKGLATMTGDHLKMTSPERTLTADQKFEYYVTDGKLNAIGNAVVVQQTDTIRADQMSAILKDDPKTGKRKVDTLTADGNVVITTTEEVLKGRRGIYDANTNIARLIGDVTITRGPNVLTGAEAELNLTTNVSKMIGGSGPSGRVSGRFYPDSNKNSDKSGSVTNTIDPNAPYSPPPVQPQPIMPVPTQSAPAQTAPLTAPQLTPPTSTPKLMTRP